MVDPDNLLATGLARNGGNKSIAQGTRSDVLYQLLKDSNLGTALVDIAAKPKLDD